MRHYFWALVACAVPSVGYAQSPSHNYINTMRSSYQTHVFVSQSVEGEFGDYREEGDYKNTGTVASTGVSNAKWQGHNVTTTVGLEVLKFVQFTMAHSSMNLRSTRNGLEHLGGSRFSGGARLVFLAPVANLELGGGVIGTRYDYQKDLQSADFYGSGFYYSIGMNYFISERVSFFSAAKLISEHSVKNGGDSETHTITGNTTNLGLGFSLWL